MSTEDKRFEEPDLRRLLQAGLDRRGFIIGTGAAGLSAFLAACGGGTVSSGTSAPRKVGFSFPYTAVDVYKPLIAGAKESAAKRNWTVLESTANGDASKQLAEIQAWIAQKVDALVVLPTDPNAITPLVAKAHQAGIKWVTYSTSIPGEDGYMKWDDLQGSDIVTEAAAKWVSSKGPAKIGQLGLDSVSVGKARDDEMMANFQKLVSGSTVVAKASANTAADALKTAQPMLQAHPEINVMLCVDDDDWLGVAQAVKAVGKSPSSIFLTGLDGSKAAMEKLLSGEVTGADGALDLKAIGRAVVDLPANIIEKKEPTSIVFKYILITNDTKDQINQLIAAYGS